MTATLRLLVAAATLAAMLTGCATAPTRAMLTYQTTPVGAELFEGGKSIGVEPVTRTYVSDGKPGKDGKPADITTPEVKAVWPSGATTTFYTVLPVGADNNAVLERPANAPGLQADLDNAAKLENDRKLAAARNKELMRKDIARASDRCKAQQAGQSLAVSDDCN